MKAAEIRNVIAWIDQHVETMPLPLTEEIGKFKTKLQKQLDRVAAREELEEKKEELKKAAEANRLAQKELEEQIKAAKEVEKARRAEDRKAKQEAEAKKKIEVAQRRADRLAKKEAKEKDEAAKKAARAAKTKVAK